MSDPRPPDDDRESEAERRRSNLVLLLVAAGIVVVGVWLVNWIIDQRKLEECFESGRRNCVPINTQDREVR
jgi:hypothetical protein